MVINDIMFIMVIMAIYGYNMVNNNYNGNIYGYVNNIMVKYFLSTLLLA